MILFLKCKSISLGTDCARAAYVHAKKNRSWHAPGPCACHNHGAVRTVDAARPQSVPRDFMTFRYFHSGLVPPPLMCILRICMRISHDLSSGYQNEVLSSETSVEATHKLSHSENTLGASLRTHPVYTGTPDPRYSIICTSIYLYGMTPPCRMPPF